MEGLRTGIILGAGASYCYEDGEARMPVQRDIVGKLFMGLYLSSPQIQVDYVGGPYGLKHSSPLASFLQKRFNIPENSRPEGSEGDFWTVLQEHGYTLESLYSELEAEYCDDAVVSSHLEDFAAIIRTSVREPVADRSVGKVCRYHRAISEALEPGDYIINFNWDTLMADALLFFCPLWFPSTGLGLRVSNGQMLEPRPKALRIESMVRLLHVHGAVFLFESEPGIPQKQILYTGPGGDSSGSTLLAAGGIDPENFNVSEGDARRISLGCILHGDERKWFGPIFVPPSHDKPLDSGGYPWLMRRQIHSALPQTRRLIIAGYSFPDADTEHIERLFPQAILDPTLEVIVVNPSAEDEAFRAKVEGFFPAQPKQYSKDFRSFCLDLVARYKDSRA